MSDFRKVERKIILKNISKNQLEPICGVFFTDLCIYSQRLKKVAYIVLFCRYFRFLPRVYPTFCRFFKKIIDKNCVNRLCSKLEFLFTFMLTV